MTQRTPQLLAALALAALSFASALACRTAHDTAHSLSSAPVALVDSSCEGIKPLTSFGSLWLAGQPSVAALEELARRGVRHVVNMRHEREPIGYDERAAVEALGMSYEHRPWNGAAQLDDQVFADYRAIFSRVAEPTLVHCGSANRVGALWIAWRALDGGLELEQAVAEARRVGLSSAEYEAKAREYVARNSR